MLAKKTYWLHSKPISKASLCDLLTNTELWVVFPRWPSTDFKTGSLETIDSLSSLLYCRDQCCKLILNNIPVLLLIRVLLILQDSAVFPSRTLVHWGHHYLKNKTRAPFPSSQSPALHSSDTKQL